MSDTFIINTDDLVRHEDNSNEPYPIYNGKSEILKRKIEEYTGDVSTSKIQKIIQRLDKTRKIYNAIGLSANQCGINLRMFVIGAEEFNLVCINPKVISKSEIIKKDEEMCISFPGLKLKIDRPSYIDVEFTDEHNELIKMRLHGLTARYFLHELDHLDGICFTDKVGKMTLQLAENKRKKLIKKILKK